MTTVNPGKYQRLDPLAFGEDAVISLTSGDDGAGRPLAVVASFASIGPPDPSLSGLSVAYVGGSTHAIHVTVPAAATAPLTAAATIYAEVWQTGTGSSRPLARLLIPVYDPVRPA